MVIYELNQFIDMYDRTTAMAALLPAVELKQNGAKHSFIHKFLKLKEPK